MSNLVRAEQAQASALVPRNSDECLRIAEMAAKERLFGVRSPQEAFIRVLAGMSVGLNPIQAMGAIHVIEGRPTLSASMMVAVCMRETSICEKFHCVESTAEKATYVTKRRGQPEMTLTFTIEQAQKAGLTGRGPWKAHTEDMLRARAASKLARMVYPDLLAGMYTPDEVVDIPAQSAPIEAEVVPVPVVADDGPLAVLIARLAGANSYEHLKSIASDRDFLEQTKTLSDADRVALRKKYDEMQRALKSKPQVAA